MKYSLTLAAAVATSYFQLIVAADNIRGLIGNVDLDKWQSAYVKARAFTEKLSLSEKATIVTGGNVTTGQDSFPGITISDGQQGVLLHYFVSGWGQPSAVAMSWDKTAIYDQAKAIGTEFKIRGIHVCDGPTSSPVGRTAWGGRQAEAYGFDSYLNGIAFGLSVEAELDAGVIPAGKHFLLYEQESNRMASDGAKYDSYNVLVNDKALHETYLAPWYDAVKNGIGAAMCAMNLVNGSYSCESEPLLMGLLKEELGFPGFVVPDISGQKTLNGSANGGLDWASDQLWNVSNVVDLVQSGQVSEARIDDMVIRNVIGWYQIKADQEFPSQAEQGSYRAIPKNHRKLIRENGRKSMVLLKNENNALPLKSPKSLSVFGAHAGAHVSGPNEAFTVFGVPEPVYQGHLATTGGAGASSLPYLVTPLQALTERVANDGTQFRWILNDTFSGGSTGFISSGASTGTNPSIVNYAQFSEVCLVFLNAWGGEGKDRTELRNKAQDNLVNTVAANCNNTIVVVNTIGPRILDAWVGSSNVTAVLYGAPLGQESGNSIVDVLYGDYNPSAALTYTIAKTEDDYSARPCTNLDCEFSEGNYIDYKHFDRADIEPRFAFGFGMSYTAFDYSSLGIQSKAKPGLAKGKRKVGGRADLWDRLVTVSLVVKNIGELQGEHIVQLYLTFPSEADQPIRQLRGFDKIKLKKGESKKVELKLRRRDLSYWDVAAQEWRVARGEYLVNVGASSRDFKLHGKFYVE